MRHTTFLIVLFISLALAGPALATSQTLTMDPEDTQISFLLEATGSDVEGTLYLRDGWLEIDPEAGTVSGELTIDATRTDTGHKKRDKTMHAKVLESEAHPLIVFKAESLKGRLPASGSGQIEVAGTVSIDGGDHPLTLPTDVEIDGGHFKATTRFPVPFVDWGMHDPSVLFLRVSKVVDVTVEASGTVSGSTVATEIGSK